LSLWQKKQSTFPNFSTILCLTSGSGKYGALSPYEIKDEQGRLHENLWQFSKVYPQVPLIKSSFSDSVKRIVWDYHEETHFESGILKDEYWIWREKGYLNPEPVRYPVGKNLRSTCLFSIPPTAPRGDSSVRLGYVDSRKAIYFPLFVSLVKKYELYGELLERLQNGENLLIVEVDGPHEEDLGYYKSLYGVGNDFIVDNSMEVTPGNIDIMLNDAKNPFGHGYCLAACLLKDIDNNYDLPFI